MLRRLYQWTMAKASHRHAERWLALFAFVEASFFPIPPHPVLGLMCLAEPKKAVRFAVIATLASVAGGMLGYAIGALLYDTVGTQILQALGLTEGFHKLKDYFVCHQSAVFAAFAAKGITPIPFKLLTITAGFTHLPLLTFIGASLVSRSISFMIVGILFRLFGTPIKSFIDKYLPWLTAAFVIAVVSGFVMFSSMGSRTETTSEKCDNAVSAPA
jgi:membrane protein YqaA with SNARE-associated domain